MGIPKGPNKSVWASHFLAISFCRPLYWNGSSPSTLELFPALEAYKQFRRYAIISLFHKNYFFFSAALEDADCDILIMILFGGKQLHQELRMCISSKSNPVNRAFSTMPCLFEFISSLFRQISPTNFIDLCKPGWPAAHINKNL